MRALLVVGIFIAYSGTTARAQVCRISTSGLNRNRSVTGPIHSECPPSVHSVPFGNWGVTSNFGQKQDDHQFQGWCHDVRVCDNRGVCRSVCQDGWYEWNSCTDIDEFKAPNCTLYNDKDCTMQVSPLGQNIHGTRSVDLTVRCPRDTNGDGVADEGGCADIKTFSNGTNFMSLYELDPLTGDDLMQTLYFPDTVVNLSCGVFGCPPAQSGWVPPSMYDSPSSPAKIFAEFSMSVNSAVFVDTSRACRAVAPAPTTVPAASFKGSAVAPESIASAFGFGLATSAASATSLPLPTELNGTRVTVTDSSGVARPAPLFYVSPDQANFEIPAGTAAGAAKVSITRTDTVASQGTVQVAPVAPDLFSANGTGQGVAAATAIRGTSAVPVFQCSGQPLVCVALPIAVDTGTVYLTLYATGIRGATRLSDVVVTIGGTRADVLYAGPQGQFVGLDQINLVVPPSLRGRGEVAVQVTIAGTASNVVTVAIQ